MTSVPATPGPGTPPGPPPETGPTGAVPVYFTVLDRNGSPRLIREFHRIPAADGSPAARAKAAIAQMLTSGSAYDPDYRSIWPAGTSVRSVAVAGSILTVDLTGMGAAAPGGSEASAVAVAQLVWTATAASGLPEVRVHVDGGPVDELWGHVDTRAPLRRAAPAEVLALVWLISPQHGDTVGREVTLHIAGIAFEATLHYEIRRGSSLIKEGFVTLDRGAPDQGQAKTTVTLDPGTYVITAFMVSAEDSSHQYGDDHTITVQ